MEEEIRAEGLDPLEDKRAFHVETLKRLAQYQSGSREPSQTLLDRILDIDTLHRQRGYDGPDGP